MSLTAPAKPSARNWKRGVDALHSEAFDVLEEACEPSEDDVDGNAVTLTYLTRKEFRDVSPLKQGRCIRLLTRQVLLPRQGFGRWETVVSVCVFDSGTTNRRYA